MNREVSKALADTSNSLTFYFLQEKALFTEEIEILKRITSSLLHDL